MRTAVLPHGAGRLCGGLFWESGVPQGRKKGETCE